MIAILTVLIALPLGYLVRRRLVAYVAYGLAFAHVYTFQTASLLMEWTKGSDAAFPRTAGTPESIGDMPWGYFTFTTVGYAVGFGLVTLGHWLGARRDSRRNAVDLDGVRG